VRVAVILIAALWGILAVTAFALGRNRSRDARMSAGYILAYPVLAVILILNDPVPMWLAVPAVFGFIPWLLAGPHLWRITADPSRGRPDEWIGIPKAYWLWGGLGALALGLVFS
jgi:hypothetical protein